MVARTTYEPCKVLFLGGPRHGNYRDYPRDPVLVGCISEGQAKNMHGLYKTEKFEDGVVTMKWIPMPRSKNAQDNQANQ